jgi:FkbM family methyltransferase
MRFLKEIMRAVGHRGIAFLGYREHRTGHALVLVPATDGAREHAYELASYVLETRLQELLHSTGITIVIDVGANEGQFARRLREMKYRGRIVSFEPNPALLPALQAQAERDGQWTVVASALGAEEGEAELHVTASSDYASLHALEPDTAPGRTDAMAITDRPRVAITTLARWVEEHPGTVGEHDRLFIKTDTQGHDLEVLTGAGPLLPRALLILSELAQLPLYAGVPLVGEGISWLRDRGFALAALAPVGGIDPASGAAVEFDGLFVALTPKG